jgi:hypothetical protein
MSVSGERRASEKFAELSERAKQVERRVGAAQNETKAEVEHAASEAKAAVKAHADKLRENASSGQASWERAAEVVEPAHREDARGSARQ